MKRNFPHLEHAAACRNGQGDLAAHAINQALNSILISYPAALAHARANLTSILAGTYHGPLAGILTSLNDLLAQTNQLPALTRTHIPNLLPAQHILDNPLNFPHTEPMLHSPTSDQPHQLEMAL